MDARWIAVSTGLAVAFTGLASDAPRPNFIVFFTDDHGYADLGAQGVVSDVRTPHLDGLAADGVRMPQGYVTAPQCVPSRAGLLVGRAQNRFGVEHNRSPLDGFSTQTTLAERLRAVGYVTAMFGKWHLGPAQEIPQHGFQHVFAQHEQTRYYANIGLDGRDRPMGLADPELYHVDACSRAAAAIIERYRDRPFFLYVAYRAPHTPLDPPPDYLARFPGPMPERRRRALAMLAAVDDGVGLIRETLRRCGLTERTLIFFASDNGAPLAMTKPDTPVDLRLQAPPDGGWDGSLNDPLSGEKGMLAEGGIRVPFLVAWPSVVPSGRVFPHPVSSLDIAATICAAANIAVANGELDGVNLLPFLRGQCTDAPHEVLCWRWVAQCAIRDQRWKYLRVGEREYLFDLVEDPSERQNRIAQFGEVADRLRQRLDAWLQQLQPPGWQTEPASKWVYRLADFHLEGRKEVAEEAVRTLTGGWASRGGRLVAREGCLVLVPTNGARSAYLVRSGVRHPGPLTLRIQLRTDGAGEGQVQWRHENETDFVPAHRARFAVASSGDWQTCEVSVPTTGTVIHWRIVLPFPTTEVRRIQVQTSRGTTERLWGTSP